MKYYVFEGRNIGIKGKPEFVETVMFATDDKMEASKFEDELRKTYKDRTIVDCYVKSEEEIDRAKRAKERYEALSEEQKHEFITVDGRTYIKALYEHKNVK